MDANLSENNDVLILVIQHISIWWSKSSRGGKLAEKRNQIPRVFPLPSWPPTYNRRKHYLVHRIQFDEHNKFVEPLNQTVTVPGIEFTFDALNCRVETERETPIIKFLWRDGAPIRVEAKSFNVPQVGWVQVECNARFSCRDFGMWSYQHEIFNVALAHPECLDLFTTSQPSRIYQDLAYLW